MLYNNSKSAQWIRLQLVSYSILGHLNDLQPKVNPVNQATARRWTSQLDSLILVLRGSDSFYLHQFDQSTDKRQCKQVTKTDTSVLLFTHHKLPTTHPVWKYGGRWVTGTNSGVNIAG